MSTVRERMQTWGFKAFKTYEEWAELLDALKDAERYQWLRQRLQVRNEQAVSGRVSSAIVTRIGQSFLDSPTRGSKGYTSPERFDEECAALDAAIDTALEKEKQ